MTLFLRLPRRLLSAIGFALVFAVPVVYAAELEGTIVTVDPSPTVQTDTHPPASPDASPQPDAPAPEGAPVPPTNSDEHQQWLQEHKDYAREQEDHAREQADHAREQGERAREMETQMRDHQNWEHDWEKNLSQAFGGDHHNGNDGGPSGMETLIVLFSVIALITTLCSPLILIGVFLVLRHKAKMRHQQMLNNNIDKLLAAGRDIPVELLRGDEPKVADDTGNQAKGIRNICLGAGWLVFLTIAFDIEIGAIGFIWIGLGLSQVLIWYLNKPAESTQAGQQD